MDLRHLEFHPVQRHCRCRLIFIRIMPFLLRIYVLGSFYGTHPWYWYIVAAVPTLAHAYLPLVIGGAAYSPKKFLLAAAGWYIFVFSFISHKEFRFLLPILPVMLIYAGYFMDMLNTRRPKGSRSLLSHPLFMLLLLANLGMALYFSTLHQRGTTDVMWYIQQNPNVSEVMFLMPCHSTPYYAYVHRNIPMNFLDCSPRYEYLPTLNLN
jgi:phosphatidylinositol glycan class B